MVIFYHFKLVSLYLLILSTALTHNIVRIRHNANATNIKFGALLYSSSKNVYGQIFLRRTIFFI